MKESGFDQIIRPLLDQGFVYSGFSAGSMVVGNTLEYFDQFDPEDEEIVEPKRIYDGIGLIDTAILPHWQNGDPKRESQHLQIIESYKNQNEKIVTLTDNQAIIKNGSDLKVIG